MENKTEHLSLSQRFFRCFSFGQPTTSDTSNTIHQHHHQVERHHKQASAIRNRSPTYDSIRVDNNLSAYISSNVRQGTTHLETNHADHQLSTYTLDEELGEIVAKYNKLKKLYEKSLCEIENLKECMNSGHQHEQELEMDNQNLHNNNKELAIQNKNLLNSNSNLHIQIQTLIDKEEDLLNQLESASKTNRKFLAELDQLKDINEDLEKQYDELTRKFNKKVESYKELNKNYMELVRPLRVSDDDHSTIYNRLSRIRVSIESLVQSVKSESFVIPKKDVVINFFSMYICLDAFCVEEADLDSYHISLLMESAVMSILIVQLFSRALGCIFPQSQEFENISKWVEGQDAKIATRWRQQLCILITQDSGALKCMKSHEVNQAAMILSKLFSDVHPNVDVSAKIIDLCSKSFDLAIDMFGMESRIYPVSTPLGTPFDDTTMKTPQRSNPTGTVSLDIFPSFRNDDDDDPFYIEPKVWCS